MSREIDKAYDPKQVESRIYALWEKSGFFNPDNLEGKKTFTIVLPPPNITGSLHMGHALNAAIQDILIRRKRMLGFRTLWLPGTDHAGIATQNVVEKDLKKKGITRHELGREKFLEKVWEWREKYGHIILDQLKTLGASCDWSRTRFTLDKPYAKAVTAAFLDYYAKGWIYRADRVINWCPRCQTSLSDLELEYTEETGKLWYIKYPLARDTRYKIQDTRYIVVATTRPETMLGDMAVAVNPEDKRYKDLVGRTAILPIQNREIPIIADAAIDAAFGTGAVKVTPNHDLADFDIAQRHHLPLLQVINERGKMTDAAGPLCAGAGIHECRDRIVKELEKQGLLEKTEDYTHRVGRCYRCNTVVEPLVSKQWFLKMEELGKMAAKAVESGKVAFVPDRWEKIYLDWLKNIRDWCLSRQIWWGHRLPVWFCQNKTGISNSQLPITKKNGNASADEKFIVSAEKPDQCPFCQNCQMEQSTDVLDTWFSSALWPFATLGWPDRSGDLKDFYPTDVLSTARDILNLWVSRMIFSGSFFMKKEPFRRVYIHATVLTKEGKRMSKSLGTGINPLDLVEKYGADAVRFGLIYQTMGGQDLHFSEEHILAGKKFCNKIWNASRFVMKNRETGPMAKNDVSKSKNLSEDDKQILQELAEIAKKTNQRLDNFEFGQALHELYDFFWHSFCDRYIETAKKENTAESKRILIRVLTDSLKLLHPFIPFVTEEVYQSIRPEEGESELLMIENYPQS